jgi:hypothetical protein
VICLQQRTGQVFQDKRVWIAPQIVLLDWLRGQRNTPIAFEQLARYADNLS